MGRIAASICVLVVAGLASCGGGNGAPTIPTASGSEAAVITVYRDGDPRFTLEVESIYRMDGYGGNFEAVAFEAPVALVVETTVMTLSEGKQELALSRIPTEALASSIWLQSLTAPDRVQLDSVEPEPVDALLGRRVRVEMGETTIVGTVVDTASSLTVATDEGQLWMVHPYEARIAVESDGRQRPLATLEVTRAGEHVLELGYSTAAIDWSCNYTLDLSDEGEGSVALNTASALVTIQNATSANFSNAEFALFSGSLSSSKRHPIELWRGRATIAAKSSVEVPIALPTLELTSGYEYRPFVRVEAGSRTQPGWGQTAQTAVARVLWLKPAAGQTLVAGKFTLLVDNLLHEAALRERVTGPAIASIRVREETSLFGRRTQRATRQSRDGDTLTESIEIEVQNRGDVARKVKIVDRLLRSPRFEIEKSKPKATMVGDEIQFEIEVEGRKRKSVTYTVRYSI